MTMYSSENKETGIFKILGSPITVLVLACALLGTLITHRPTQGQPRALTILSALGCQIETFGHTNTVCCSHGSKTTGSTEIVQDSPQPKGRSSFKENNMRRVVLERG